MDEVPLSVLRIGHQADEPVLPRREVDIEDPGRPLVEELDAAPSRVVERPILGPDGESICRTIPPQDTLFVLAVPEDPALPFPEGSLVACPDNNYSISVEPGNYLLRAEFFVWDEDVVRRNIQIRQGTPLGGVATLHGEPFPGVVVVPLHEFTFGFGIGGLSGRNGRWHDALPLPPFTPVLERRPMILQNDRVYQVVGECSFILGTTVIEDFPLEPFTFPSERRAVDCELASGPTRRLTHTRNRIAVTSLPGDIGGLSADPRFPDLGTG